MVWFDDEMFDEMRYVGRLMNRLFGDFEKPALTHKGQRELSRLGEFRLPVCDMYETEGSVVATFELPGVDKNDIELNVTDDFVEVKVQKRHEHKSEDKSKGFYRYESRSQQFYRRVPLPTEVNAEDTKAEFRNGVLKIEVPKTRKIKERKKRIEIQ